MLGLGALGPLFASCAESNGGESNLIAVDAAETIDATDVLSNTNDGGPCAEAGCAPATCEEGSFCPVSTPADPRRSLLAIWGSGKDDVWVVGSNGTILHRDGTSWAVASSGTTETLFSVWGSGPEDIWVTSNASLILHGTGWNGGAATWSPGPSIPFNPGNNTYGVWGKLMTTVWGTSAADVWVAGDVLLGPPPESTLGNNWQENVWRRVVLIDGGASWASKPPGDCVGRSGSSFGPNIQALWGSGPDNVWAVAAGGRTFHAMNAHSAAQVWTEVESQTTSQLYAVWGSGANDIWTVGARGTIRHWTNAPEQHWEIVESPTQVTLRGIWGSGPENIWAVGENGVIVHYDGHGWTASLAVIPNSRGALPNLYGVWGSGPEDVWAVGEGVVLKLFGENSETQGTVR